MKNKGNNRDILIKIKNLSKKFKNKEVFKELNLNIYKNEVLAILGPNGSGKTTLLNIIIGLSKQTSGKVELVNFKNQKDFFKKLGIQFQNSDFPKGYTTNQMVDLVFQFANRKPSGISFSKWVKTDGLKLKKQLYKTFQLEGKEKTKAIKLSGGEKQRLNVMLALLSKPEILIVDEITTGLDITAQSSILTFINNFKNKQNKTLILVSHNINEIDRLADRIVILDKKKITKDFTRDEIIRKYKSIPNFLNSYFIERNMK